MEQQHFKMGWLAKALVEAMTLISQEAPSFGFPVHFETGKLDYLSVNGAGWWQWLKFE